MFLREEASKRDDWAVLRRHLSNTLHYIGDDINKYDEKNMDNHQFAEFKSFNIVKTKTFAIIYLFIYILNISASLQSNPLSIFTAKRVIHERINDLRRLNIKTFDYHSVLIKAQILQFLVHKIKSKSFSMRNANVWNALFCIGEYESVCLHPLLPYSSSIVMAMAAQFNSSQSRQQIIPVFAARQCRCITWPH